MLIDVTIELLNRVLFNSNCNGVYFCHTLCILINVCFIFNICYLVEYIILPYIYLIVIILLFIHIYCSCIEVCQNIFFHIFFCSRRFEVGRILVNYRKNSTEKTRKTKNNKNPGKTVYSEQLLYNSQIGT